MVGGIFAILVPLLGDDLAVNAEKASVYNASRELPVPWEIAIGEVIVKSLPKVIKLLSVIETVTGGLIVHHIYHEYFIMMPLLGFEFFTALLIT